MKIPFQSARRALNLSLLGGVTTLAVLAGTAQAADATRVIVAYKPGAASEMRALVSQARGAVELEIAGMNAMAVTVPSAAVVGLARNPRVEYVEEDVKRYPLALTSPSATPYASGQLEPWGIRAVQAHLLPQGDALTVNRKVCIIDSGYSMGHEDLPSGANVSGYNGNLAWNVDGDGHGTHVAGTIAALNNTGTGVVGVNAGGNLNLYIVRVFGDSGAWAYSSTLVDAATRCQNAGANVVSMSLGGSLSSRTEQTKFQQLLDANILPIAAAGNGGNSRTSYPAGYASVVSVAAVDVNNLKADFSQYNKDVEISGPGVGVLSTVPTGKGLLGSLDVGGLVVEAFPMEGSPAVSRSGALFNFGLGDAVNAGASGKVCLIARGTIDFATKVSNCQASGGVGAVIYNNVAGAFSGTLGTTVTNIPSVSISQEDGNALLNRTGQATNVGVGAANYAYYDGTSMATPHVSAVAALVWSYFTPAAPTAGRTCTAAQLRNSLNKSAKDLGAAGRDNNFGFGLVQARAAYDRIVALGCGN
ncbi:MAG TPA: S8 family serine peptidase [Burkholderiaceae bacterium]|nr:S8 family serine peptidase [Burkholderiaceae bacterium]